MTEARSLTEGDVKAIVTELKRELVQDFKMEVASGLWGWIKKILVQALMVLLFYLAVQGMAGDKHLFQTIAAGK